MALRRVFVNSVTGGEAVVEGHRAHHLHRVARLRRGELVEVSDSRQAFLAEVKRSRASEVAFAIREGVPSPASPVAMVAGLAIFKFARMEMAIEKATELGAAVIAPLIAERCDKGLVQGAFKRRERWERIGEEAAGQSRRLAPPRIEAPIPLLEALQTYNAGLRLILDMDSPLMKETLGSCVQGSSVRETATLLIGPEGGWTDSERQAARQAGYQAVSLGGGILRAETAAIAALSVFSHWLSG